MQAHRNVNWFSHCGMVLKTPLLPRDGHYLRSGAIDKSVKVLPFVQLLLEIESKGPPNMDEAYSIFVTVLQCRGLPSQYDYSGTSEDPYVKVTLAPCVSPARPSPLLLPATIFS